MTSKGILVALAVVCAVAGCRKSTTYTAKDGTRATVSQSGKVTVESKDGKMQVSGEGGLALPDDFPKDVPVYPGSTVTMSMAAKDGTHVTLKSADPASKVVAFYKEKLKENGWEIETTMNTEEMSMVSGKKEKRTVMAMTNRDSGGSIVSLTVQQEK